MNNWSSIDSPGYLGKQKDALFAQWDARYGNGNWRIAWIDAQGKRLRYEDIITHYIDGYVLYFTKHPQEAKEITQNYSHSYDMDILPQTSAFDIYIQYQKQGIRNQFHHIALNIALEKKLGMPFRGKHPLQVRDSISVENKPVGWKWSPGYIPSPQPERIPQITHTTIWWDKNSIEDFYQSTKVLEVKKV